MVLLRYYGIVALLLDWSLKWKHIFIFI